MKLFHEPSALVLLGRSESVWYVLGIVVEAVGPSFPTRADFGQRNISNVVEGDSDHSGAMEPSRAEAATDFWLRPVH